MSEAVREEGGAPLEVAVAVCRTLEEEALVRRLVEPAAAGRARLLFSRSKSHLAELISTARVLFAEKLDPALLARAPLLDWVHLSVAGVERALTPELLGSPVVLTNSRGMHSHQVAEHALGLMLSLVKRLDVAARAQARHEWAYREIASTNSGLAGRSCVILGLGSIGLQIARLASAFGLRCTGVRRVVEADGAEPPEFLERLTDSAGLDSALRGAEFLVLALPLTPATRGLLDRRRLALLPPGAYLVNVARGALVDEQALVEALREGRLAGAALDVASVEPLPPDSPLWDQPGVLLTPHVAGNYAGDREDWARAFARNLERYLDGKPLLNVIDKQRGY
jgi:phosphoglycerate dehydrogenase-like enzyme